MKIRHWYHIVAFVLPILCSGVLAQSPAEGDSAGIDWAEAYRFFDQPVDPDIYLVRPGEKLLITFLNARIGGMSLQVDPEGRIVHQTLGIYDISDMTLTGVREALKDALARLYNVEDIVVSVSEPRRVGIPVSGAVANPGLYKGFTSQRVSELIELAGGITRHGSSRSIVFTGGPKDIIVDLDKTTYLGDNSCNPCLYAGYSIFVPDKSSARVQVIGEVNRPREVELIPGDDLNTLIALAGGARSVAAIDSAQIIGVNGVPRSRGITPEAGDVIHVPGFSNADRDRINAFGALKSPGRFDFRSEISLRQLLDQAGGFTGEASPSLTTVFRRASADEWGRISDRRYPITSATGELDKFLELTLRLGDSVYVPYAVGYVRISGEILNPGLLPFVEGRDAAYYVGLAGGFLPTANESLIDIYNRTARVTSTVSPGVMVHDGDELIVRILEELK